MQFDHRAKPTEPQQENGLVENGTGAKPL